MTLETQLFDAAEFLDSPETVSAYLDAALADGDPALFAAVVGDIATVQEVRDASSD